jgi:hypothetical protein
MVSCCPIKKSTWVATTQKIIKYKNKTTIEVIENYFGSLLVFSS